MKKIVSVLLCAVLALGIIPFSAYADEAADGTIDIDMVWDELTFVYAPNYPGDWDIESHTYKNVPIDGWKVSDNTNNIIITNNSATVAVDVAFSFTSAVGSGIDIEFYNADDTAMEKSITGIVLASSSSETIKVIPTGELSSESGSTVKLGSITVTFSVANP